MNALSWMNIPLPVWKIRQSTHLSSKGAKRIQAHKVAKKGADNSRNFEEFGGKVCYG